MEKKQESNTKILQYLVEEVDAAREVYQLYEQMSKALPIKSFEDLKKASDKQGKLHFRDASVDYGFFKKYIPEIIFPISDEKELITRLAQFVKLMPTEIGYSTTNLEHVKRSTQMKLLSSMINNINLNIISGVSGVKPGLAEENKGNKGN